MRNQSIILKSYTGTIILIGSIFVILGLRDISLVSKPKILFFICISIIIESLRVRVKNNTAFSISFTIGLTTVFIFKSFVVALIAFITMLVYIDRNNGKSYHLFNSDSYKRIFNGCAYAVSLACAVMVYNLVETNFTGLEFFEFNVPGIIATIFTYTVTYTTIFIGLMCIIDNKSYSDALSENVMAIINIVALSPLGIIIAIAYTHYGWFAVVMFLGPLLIARYSFKLYIDMRSVFFETIKALSNAMEAKDEYTQGHSYRVAQYAVGIATEMGLRKEIIEKINTAAVLHDIGKIGISDLILNKTDALTEEEFINVRNHPEIGAKILLEVDFLKEVAEIIKYHHERYDGNGYPMKLKGEEIPIESSILSVADAYDAMSSDRAYRQAMNPITAQKIIAKESGKQFDPKVVNSFISYMKKYNIEKIKEEILENEQIHCVS